MLRGGNLFYSLSRWDDGKLNIRFPPNFTPECPVCGALIYDDNPESALAAVSILTRLESHSGQNG